jgi:hypothetical protein
MSEILHEFYALVANSGVLPAEWAVRQIALGRDPWQWLVGVAGTIIAGLDLCQ